MSDNNDENKKKNEGKKPKKQKADFATPIGLLLGLGVVILAIYSNAQFEGVVFFVQLSSALIVFGGLSAAILVNYSFKEILYSIKLVIRSFKKDKLDIASQIPVYVELARTSRSKGMLALEDRLEEIEDDFAKKGLQLAIDGYEQDEVETIMQKELYALEERHLKGQDILEKGGDYSPAWGMIGTLIGLVLMLMDLDDPSTLGPSMAVAMLTTLYGAVLANLVFIPLLGKMEARHAEEMYAKHFALEGIRAIQEGQIPTKLRMKLDSYVKKDGKKDKKKEKKKGGEDNGEKKAT